MDASTPIYTYTISIYIHTSTICPKSNVGHATISIWDATVPRLGALSHPILEGKSNVNHVRARIRTHVHSDYIIGHHHTMLELNSAKVLSYIKMSETSIESIT
jgi:hypothetical protein